MALTLELDGTTEGCLRERASRAGMAPEELACKILRREFVIDWDDPSGSPAKDGLLIAASTLRRIWDTPEEDEAWKHL